MAKGIFNGRYIKIDYSSVPLNDDLLEAMQALDADCAHGCGGTWEIHAEDPENGVPYRAIFIEMATDELVWNSEAGSWTDGTDEDEDEEEEEDDEEYMLAFVG